MSVFPRYEGYSLLNLPPSVCRAFGVPAHGLASPLDASVLPPRLLEDVRTVILLVVDGLGRQQLDDALRDGAAPFLAELSDRAVTSDDVTLSTITSVFPSSTMPALATINTGLPPSAHGLIGWTVYLEEFGEPAELARWGPADRPGSYLDEALGSHDPVAFAGVETIYQRFARSGVRSIVICPAQIRRSGFSQMTFQGADVRGYYATSSVGPMIERATAEATDGQPTYIHAYWPTVDLIGHRLGPATAEHAEEIATLDFTLGRWIRRRGRRGDTLLLLTADHGHVPGDLAGVVRLDQEPDLLKELFCLPTGERRLAYLHVKPGRVDAVRDFCSGRLPAAELLDPPDAFERGLFGPGPISPASCRRAGDLILLARGDHQFVCPFSERQRPDPLLGNHGALAPSEMEVPLLALRI
jgi:hypothetical protein